MSKVKKTIAVTYKLTGIRNYQLQYANYTDSDLKNNLIMIDSLLPEILAEVVLYHYRHNVVSMTDGLARLIAENPMNYNQSLGHSFYERKIKSFLSCLILGFPDSLNYTNRIACDVINGTGNSIYNPYHPNKFEQYLLNAAKLVFPIEHPQKKLVMENDESFITFGVEFRF